MKWLVNIFISISILFIFSGISGATVPVRISVKFILDKNDTRAASGNIYEDFHVINQVVKGNGILSGMKSEFRMELLEIVDVPGVSQWFDVFFSNNTLIDIRLAALADPTLYKWRDDAINIYINGGPDAGIGAFPPFNSLFLIGTTARTTTFLHELGHNLFLLHTHELDGNDLCADTLIDHENWDKDSIAKVNFSCLYADCTPSQRAQVDMVSHNVMSYHAGRDRFSPCQMNRKSTQGDNDKTWLLTKEAVYVDSNSGSFIENGGFLAPFKSIQNAVNSKTLTGKVMVLQKGNYTPSTVINDDVEIVPRSGISLISSAPDQPLYRLPVLELSESPELVAAILPVKKADSAARLALKDGERAAAMVTDPRIRSSILASANKEQRDHSIRARDYMLEAEKIASGDEKLVIQRELGKRYARTGDCELASGYFRLVVEGTDQKYLKEEMLRVIKECAVN